MRGTVASPPGATPVVEWDEFYPWFLENWHQGEHVTLIGPTGWGKTTVLRRILVIRSFLAVFAVKGDDESMEELIHDLRLDRMTQWNPDVSDRVCLWPDIRGAGKGHRRKQREVFAEAIDSIFRMGAWCPVFDEVVYLSETLGLDDELKFLLNQGRSSHISVVAATQRPAFIPLAFYDMATHLFLWKFQDIRNVQRVAELTGEAAPVIRQELMTLPKYEFIYINKDTGLRIRTTAQV
jgi:hypothetical protein